MISAVILAEFDISSGNLVRLQYPAELSGVDPEQIAAMMIPDGAHNAEHEITTFILRKNIKENFEEEKFQKHSTEIPPLNLIK
mmetsp:Transcript_27185/g.31358  ORF Transcript_27185/g.31358 Transcript_27185/m.31358 type:complete len:83 (+) Transcript_27185:3-251(+)